ncbi:uncharacterized protein MONBRDRAFT_25391 [Monosiga brevicollis MX1]|uniref:CDP-diacylglycerol--inositol 3-phosphatidyltransferase n=1 Tax=Monosiga brevicollis TaxID=81824 RepID=A9UZA1_MONBE|nr:uncharacterized protein MONBRDRAFT_25391 [Monosiga brevicollis MX1]EDQ89332.1 predicted protein [Monosiga brevicollis MX1]|eukprot:XP_001745908.1 hypothetical protein [Monosiga brevicollis MX1]
MVMLQLLPDALALPILSWHHRFVYDPLNRLMSSLANSRFFPRCLSPNAITFAAGACLIPCIHLLQSPAPTYLAAAGGLALLHDMLDRLDGAVARADHNKGRAGGDDGKFGAFLDAQVDKLFHIGMLTALLMSPLSSALGTFWRRAAYIKIAVQATLAIVRFQDYFSTAPKRAIQARGEGKLATCAANMAAVLSLWTFALHGVGYPQAAQAGMVVTSVLITIAVDMALRSLSNKLNARAEA